MSRRPRPLPALRLPLSRHPLLTPGLGSALYAWVGEALRDALVGRFNLDRTALDAAVGDAVSAARAEPIGRLVSMERPEEREVMEHRLVEKLDAAGQLKPGYLVRALRENKLGLFEVGLARLAGLGLKDLRAALAHGRPDMLALACVAAGIDRSVFKTVLTRVRELNGGRPDCGADGDPQAQAVFQGMAPKEAVVAFTRMARVLGGI